MSRPCPEFGPLLGPFGDGELEPSKMALVDAHVEHCEGCRERVLLDESMRHSLKQVCKQEAPSGLKERMQAAMAAENVRVMAREKASGKNSTWFTVIPLATAAAFALAWGAMSRGPIARSTQTDTVGQGPMGDDFLTELVAEHSRPLPPERTDPQKVGELGQYVGVPVHATALHRDNGPAVIYPDGAQEWWRHGKRLTDAEAAALRSELIVQAMGKLSAPVIAPDKAVFARKRPNRKA